MKRLIILFLVLGAALSAIYLASSPPSDPVEVKLDKVYLVQADVVDVENTPVYTVKLTCQLLDATQDVTDSDDLVAEINSVEFLRPPACKKIRYYKQTLTKGYLRDWSPGYNLPQMTVPRS